MKKSPNNGDKIRARELLKKVLEKDEVEFEEKIITLLNLCDLLLLELYQTSNIKILDDINLYIQQILDIAKEQKSYWLLVESYILEVKFDLITLDLKKAQETLTKAQEIAEKNNMNLLVKRISIEQKNLQDQTDKWFKLKNSDNLIIKLTNLTPLKEQIRYMLQKREIFKRLNI
ncbi:MAG: hypothetical protein ACFE8M_13770 [Candidatus Hermodarchaeota archaeon]